MKTVVSHETALDYWRQVGALQRPRPAHSRVRTPGSALSREQARLVCTELALSLPLHLLVREQEKRPRTSSVICHTRKDPLPSGSLACINESVFVATAECCFLLEATVLELPELIDLGCELCGTYSLSPTPSNRDFDQVPQTTVSHLESFLEKAGAVRGVKQARRALRYVAPNSASSMETTLSLLLSLPYLLGGCSLTQPTFNYRIDPGRIARRGASQHYYKVDLFWERARLAVEYDSNLCHTGAERIARDSRRRDELTGLGITVITVTARQVFNVREFNKLAHTIAKCLGERIQPRDPRFLERQLELRSLLFAKFDGASTEASRAPCSSRADF